MKEVNAMFKDGLTKIGRALLGEEDLRKMRVGEVYVAEVYGMELNVGLWRRKLKCDEEKDGVISFYTSGVYLNDLDGSTQVNGYLLGGDSEEDQWFFINIIAYEGDTDSFIKVRPTTAPFFDGYRKHYEALLSRAAI